MCGIAGIIGRSESGVISRMISLQAHRGPDDAGSITLQDGLVSLGHRRLSIIDLSAAGHQPMANAAKTLWITFNGEIYNYRTVRDELSAKGYRFRSQSDTEVLLAAYEEWGEQCLDRLNGMFAFAIYDTRCRRLFAARDRLGVKPLYYTQIGGTLVFASEIKALFAVPGVMREPDLTALRTPARFQISPHTGFKNICKLPPAHFLVFENDRLTIKPYWRLRPSEDRRLSLNQAVEELDSLLDDAVRLQMIADVPVGVFLSGGLDSSIISAMMRRHSQQDIHAFTIKFSSKDQKFERMPDDSVYARRVAQQLGFEYHQLEIEPRVDELLPKLVWHLDEPLSDPAAINTYLISQAARERNIVVLLNGMGGDEVFGGYRKHVACLHADLYQRTLPRFARGWLESALRAMPVATATRGIRTLRWAKRFASFASLPEYDRYISSDLSLSREQYASLFGADAAYDRSPFYRAQQPRFAGSDVSYLTKMCLNDTEVFLPEHNLTYSDKASMAASIESRPPLTDHRIVEYMFQLPPEFRIRGGRQKFLLKKVAQRYLPAEIVDRPKSPFGSPLRAWVRGPLSELVGDLLNEASLKARGIYDYRYVRELIDNDRRGIEDNALVIWTLLTNELWFRTNFPGTQQAAVPARPQLRALT